MTHTQGMHAWCIVTMCKLKSVRIISMLIVDTQMEEEEEEEEERVKVVIRIHAHS